MTPGMIPVFPQGPNEESTYEYSEWPRWFHNPDDGYKGQIFHSADEVPEGWVKHNSPQGEEEFLEPEQEEQQEEQQEGGEGDDQSGTDGEEVQSEGDGTSQVPSGVEGERQLTADQRDDLINKLIDGNSQKDLVAMLEMLDEKVQEDGKPEIEFMSNWPKKKLAETIVDNGGPLED